MSNRGKNVVLADIKKVKHYQVYGLPAEEIAELVGKSVDTTKKLMNCKDLGEYKEKYCGGHHKRAQEEQKQEQIQEIHGRDYEETCIDATIKFANAVAEKLNRIDDNMWKVAERQDKIWEVLHSLDERLDKIGKELGV